MKNFTGTIDDFINEHDHVINKLILEKINQQEIIEEEICDIDYRNQKLVDIKNNMKDFFFQEFGDWEIALDLESFKNSFDYHFQLVNDEVEEYLN